VGYLNINAYVDVKDANTWTLEFGKAMHGKLFAFTCALISVSSFYKESWDFTYLKNWKGCPQQK